MKLGRLGFLKILLFLQPGLALAGGVKGSCLEVSTCYLFLHLLVSFNKQFSIQGYG